MGFCLDTNAWDVVQVTEGTLKTLKNVEQELENVVSTEGGTEEMVKALPKTLFPITAKHAQELANCKFHGLDMYPGWVITNEREKVEWTEFDPAGACRIS